MPLWADPSSGVLVRTDTSPGVGWVPVGADSTPGARPDTLLMFSGGIDSTWVLWDRCRRGVPTRVHHVVLDDWEGRANVEKRAARTIIAKLETDYGDELIEYTESATDFGDLKWAPYNFYLWAYWAGAILNNPKNKHLVKVVVPHHADTQAFSMEQADKTYRQVSALFGRSIFTEYPLRDKHKAEIVASLPAELLALTWFCRRPVRGEPCGDCVTCRRVLPVLADLEES